VFAKILVKLGLNIRPKSLWKKVQWLLIHWTPMNGVGVLRIRFIDPAKGVKCTVIGRRVSLKALFQKPRDRALAASYGTMQQQHAAFDTVASCRAFERIDQVMERQLQSEHRIPAFIVRIIEKSIMR